uniref:GroES-like protein n=1 Tax=Mycena chlorophos TaxID=658473 RepID=A0ABQ0L8K1_MYCCL|nr:GroES-like protein [Mycena chlorophos]
MPLPQTQSAVVIESPKAPFAVQSGLPIHKPAPGHVLLKIHSVGLNPMDPMRRTMDIMIDSYPAILGSDIAGVIEEVGEGVVGWKKGDEVFGSDTGGGYAQYHSLDAQALIRKPKNVSFDEVATLCIAGNTSLVGLYAPAPIGLAINPTFSPDKPQAGKSAFVLGAGTTCGQFGIQYLKLAGFSRIVVYASGKHTEYLTSLGATVVIPRDEVQITDLPTHLEVTSAPFDVVFDAFFGAAPDAVSSLDISHDIVKPGGKITTVNPRAVLSDDRVKQNKGVELVRAFGYYFIREGKATGLAYGVQPAHADFGLLLKENLPKLLESGELKATRVEVLPDGLEGIVKGLDRWFGPGGVSGVKLVGHPQEGL